VPLLVGCWGTALSRAGSQHLAVWDQRLETRGKTPTGFGGSGAGFHEDTRFGRVWDHVL